MSILKIHGGKKHLSKNEINRNISELKNKHSVGRFDFRIKDIDELKRALNHYDYSVETSGHTDFKNLKNRINKLVQKSRPTVVKSLHQNTENKKKRLYSNFDILTPSTFRDKFKNNNNKTFEFIINELSKYDNTINNYKEDFVNFLNKIRILCNKYKSNASRENNVGNYINENLTNILIITQIGLIQYNINKYVVSTSNRSLIHNGRFVPHELIEFKKPGKHLPQTGFTHYISKNNAEADLRRLYNSTNSKFSLNNIIQTAIIFKTSSGIIKNIFIHFNSKNDIFYKEKIIQYLEKMYDYYFSSYLYYKNLVIRCLSNLNDELLNITSYNIDYTTQIGTLSLQDSQKHQFLIVIYIIQKIMNNNFFTRGNNTNTNNYENHFNDLLSLSNNGTLGLLNQLFVNKENDLINTFKTIIENIKDKYDSYVAQGYDLPTDNIQFNGTQMCVYDGRGYLFNSPFDNQAIRTFTQFEKNKLIELTENINIGLEYAFANSVHDINKLAKSYILYKELITEIYKFPEEKIRSGIEQTGDWLKQQWRAVKAQSKRTKVSYTPISINNENNVNEKTNTIEELRSKEVDLNNMIQNLDASKKYLGAKGLPPNYISTNNGKKIENILDLSKRVKTNIESYTRRIDRNSSQNTQKIYNINKVDRAYKKLKDISKNQILTKKNISKNDGLINKMKQLGISNADLGNIIRKLRDHKVKLNQVNTKNINTKSLKDLLTKLKPIKESEETYLTHIPQIITPVKLPPASATSAIQSSNKLANLFKQKLSGKIHLMKLASIQANFKLAEEPYNNPPVHNVAQKVFKIPVGNKSIKSIKELNNISEKLKSNVNEYIRRTKKPKLDKMYEILEDVKAKFNQIIENKTSINDSELKKIECCIRIIDTISQNYQIPVRILSGSRSASSQTENDPDYNIIHINPISNSCDRRNKKDYLYIYNKFITQIETLYNKIKVEYDTLYRSNDITLGSLKHVKDCYKVINHNIKLINEKIFKLQ